MRKSLALATVAGILFALFPAAADAAPIPQKPQAFARPSSTGTLAQLRLATSGAKTRIPLTFSLAGSHVAAGRQLTAAHVNFGDGHSQRIASLTAKPRHTYAKPGGYHVKLTIVDSAGHRSTATRLVAVGGADHVVLKNSASRLSRHDVRRFAQLAHHRVRLVLGSNSKVPNARHVYIVAPKKAYPTGLIAVVEKATRNPGSHNVRLVAHDGNLSDAYRNLSVVSSTAIGRHVRLGSNSGTQSARPALVSSSAVPFTCDRSGGPSLQVTADFSNTHINSTIYAPGHIFGLDVIAKPTFSLGVQLSGSVSCHLAGGGGLYIPVPAVPGLVVSASPYFTLNASGAISATATWSPSIFLNVSRAPNDNQNLFQYRSSADASASGTAAVTLEGGIEIKVSVGEALGFDVRLGPEITVSGSASASSFCVSATSDIEVEAKLFANVLFVSKEVVLYDGHFFRSTLLNKCVSSGSGASGSGASAPPQAVGGGTVSGGAPANGTVMASPCLNVHSDAGGSAPLVGCIPHDSVIDIECTAQANAVTGPYGTDSTWDRTTYNGQQGYVADAWVYTGSNSAVKPACGSTTLPPPPASGGASGTVLASPCLNFHSSAGINAQITGCIPQNSVIGISCTIASDKVTGPYGTESTWDQTTYGGQTGYVADAWVYTGTNSSAAGPCSGTGPSPPPASATGTVLASPCLNFHNAAAISASQIGCIPVNTVITIECTVSGDAVSGPYGTESIWDRTSYGSQTGYVADAWIYTGTNGAVAGAC